MDAKQESAADAKDAILDYLDGLEVNDQADAAELADRVIDRVIAALRRDARMPQIAGWEFAVLLGDARRDIEHDIAELVDGTIRYDDVVQGVREAFEFEATK